VGKQVNVITAEDLVRVFNSEAWAGRLGLGDFQRMLNKLGIDGDAMAQELFAAFDQAQNGYLDLREVCIGMSLLLSVSWEERVSAAFAMMDVNGSGRVSREELMVFLRFIAPRTVGWHEIDHMSAEIMRTADINFSGRISWQEFLQWPGCQSVLEWIDAYHRRVLPTTSQKGECAAPQFLIQM